MDPLKETFDIGNQDPFSSHTQVLPLEVSKYEDLWIRSRLWDILKPFTYIYICYICIHTYIHTYIYIYRYFRAKVYTIWVDGALGNPGPWKNGVFDPMPRYGTLRGCFGGSAFQTMGCGERQPRPGPWKTYLIRAPSYDVFRVKGLGFKG